MKAALWADQMADQMVALMAERMVASMADL